MPRFWLLITAALDAQPLYEWSGAIAALREDSYWKSAPPALCLGSIAANWAVYEVKVKQL